MRRFAISDIHGCLQSFRALLDKIGLVQGDQLYLLGDFIDRGPDSKGVIEQVMDLESGGILVFNLTGNHEYAFLRALKEPGFYGTWMRTYGGEATIRSYGSPWDIPEKHLDWMRSLPLYHQTDGYFLVHAGLDFRVSDPLDDPMGMLYIRDWYANLNREWLGNRILVHGHTPVTKAEILKQRDGLAALPVLNIDAGCVFAGIRPGLGYLCGLDMDSLELHFVENAEAVF